MRRICFSILLLLAPTAHAEETLRDAVERAWARQPAARAQPARSEEFTAKHEAAQASFPEPPSLSAGNRNDRLNRNDGQSEWEAGVSLPLWLPGQQGRLNAVVSAEEDQYRAAAAAGKWKIAGDVRENYWQARVAQNEFELAQRKAQDAAALADDVARRVKAGDLARVDLNQAQGAERLARAALAEAEIKAFRARQAFELLTGTMTPANGVEKPATETPALDGHPQLTNLQRAVAAAQAKLRQASQDLRNNPELELAMTRERAMFVEPYANSLGIRFRFPFATDARNKPRIAAANAEMIEALAAYDVERKKISAEIEAVRRELEQTRIVVQLAETRFALATDTQQLLAKAFALGELDLVSRLRAENERFESELNFTRTKLEGARAVSRLNQALGVLP